MVMITQKLIEKIAIFLPSSKHTENTFDASKENAVDQLNEYLPSGSGIDCGSKINFCESTRSKIVIDSAYHYMDENGFYSGWFDFVVIATIDFVGIDVNVKIKRGTNSTPLSLSGLNELFSDYLSETYHYALCRVMEFTQCFENDQFTISAKEI